MQKIEAMILQMIQFPEHQDMIYMFNGYIYWPLLLLLLLLLLRPLASSNHKNLLIHFQTYDRTS